MNELTEAMVINGVVLATVLATDLGPARKIGRGRLLRPLIVAAVIIPLFLASPATHGTSLIVELAGIAAGALAGLAAAALMHVHRPAGTGKPASQAGWPYATLWALITGARAAFSWGAAHWFTTPLVTWCTTNQVTQAAITDALIFMAITMILVRTASLAIRATHLTPAPATQNATT